MKRILLIDTLALLHRAYHAIPELTTKNGIPTGALFGVGNTLLTMIDSLSPDVIVACYDRPEKTLRAQANAEYKGTRKELDDALISQIESSKIFLRACGVAVCEKAGYEADDLIGTLAEHWGKETHDVHIVSCDNDLLQLVTDGVTVHLTVKGMRELKEFHKKEVIEKFGFAPEYIPDYKGLAGDQSDNISGIKGIGEKTATTLIQDAGHLEDIYQKLKSKKLTLTERLQKLLHTGEKDAFNSRDLATIHREVPITQDILALREWRESIQTQVLYSFCLSHELNSFLKRAREKGLMNEEKSKEEYEGYTSPTQTKQPHAETIYRLGVMCFTANSDMTKPSWEEICEYTKETEEEKIEKILLEKIQKNKQEFIWENIEQPLINVLSDMRAYGILLDRKKLKSLKYEYEKNITLIEKKIYTLAKKEFNINSPKQLGEVLFDDLQLVAPGKNKTSGGARSTREEVLVSLVSQHAIIEYILKHRHYRKILTTYIETLLESMDEQDRIHPTYLQHGAVTGRFATTNPSIQNIPHSEDTKELRECFIAPKGRVIMSIDYSQVELRIASILSKDKNFIDVFKRGEDVHTSVASKMFNVRIDAVTKDMRRSAKGINFGILYGMGAQALKDVLGVTKTEAESYLYTYKDTFRDLMKFLEATKAHMYKYGYVLTAFGRRRNIEGHASKLPFIRAQAERFAINAPIQGTSADIIKIAMKEIIAALKKNNLEDDVKMIMQIHDELVFEVANKKQKEAEQLITSIMENVYPPNKDPIPLTTSVSVQDTWV
ncbi:MAG: DNA polymerase [Alphaproteobacteria bacterium]|nr:DNA polymerase [Alphaproteobacteria bacterium]